MRCGILRSRVQYYTSKSSRYITTGNSNNNRVVVGKWEMGKRIEVFTIQCG